MYLRVLQPTLYCLPLRPPPSSSPPPVKNMHLKVINTSLTLSGPIFPAKLLEGSPAKTKRASPLSFSKSHFIFKPNWVKMIIILGGGDNVAHPPGPDVNLKAWT